MYNSAPNCKGTFLCLESGECAPSLLSQVGAGWVFSSYKLVTAAIDYYQKFGFLWNSICSFTNKSVC